MSTGGRWGRWDKAMVPFFWPFGLPPLLLATLGAKAWLLLPKPPLHRLFWDLKESTDESSLVASHLNCISGALCWFLLGSFFQGTNTAAVLGQLGLHQGHGALVSCIAQHFRIGRGIGGGPPATDILLGLRLRGGGLETRVLNATTFRADASGQRQFHNYSLTPSTTLLSASWWRP